MGDHAGLAGNVKNFADGFLHQSPFVPDMHDKHTAGFRDLGGKRRQFRGIGGNARRINQPCRQAEGALRQPGRGHFAKPGNFRRRQRPLIHPGDRHAQRAVTQQYRQIGGGSRFFQARIIFRQRSPRPVHIGIAQQAGNMPAIGINLIFRQRRQAQSILPQQFGGDALPNFGRSFRFHHLQQIGMTVHVDKTRCQCQSTGINDLAKTVAINRYSADFGNKIADDCNIGNKSFFAASIDYGSSLNQNFFHVVNLYSCDHCFPWFPTFLQRRSIAGIQWRIRFKNNWVRSCVGVSKISAGVPSSMMMP